MIDFNNLGYESVKTVVSIDVLRFSRISNSEQLSVSRKLLDSIRNYLDKAGGFEFVSTGDGFIAVFDKVEQALEYSFMILSENKRLNIGSKIRIGIATGLLGKLAKGNYFGSTVNIAARLCASINSNAIILDKSTYIHLSESNSDLIRKFPIEKVRIETKHSEIYDAFLMQFAEGATQPQKIYRLSSDDEEAEDSKLERFSFSFNQDIAVIDFSEIILNLMYLYRCIRSAAIIADFLKKEKRPHVVSEIARPVRLVNIQSLSPVKGIIEASNATVNVIKAANDVLTHRKENKELKREEVAQAHEKTARSREETQIKKTEKTDKEIDLDVKKVTYPLDIALKRLELRKLSIETERVATAAFRERMAAIKEFAETASTLLDNNDEIMEIIKDGLLNSIYALTDPERGCKLKFDENAPRIWPKELDQNPD